MTTTVRPTAALTTTASGLRFAIVSAAAFGLSGPMAASLLHTGWSPGAVVLVRLGGAAAVLVIPLIFVLRRTGRPTGRQSLRVAAYGAFAIAGAQLCYFSAVQRLSVGVALLLEYLAPVLLIGWHWARHGRRPSRIVLGGAAVTMAGMALVLDLTNGVSLDPIGVLWGLCAAVCLAAYFQLATGDVREQPVPPVIMTAGGLLVGTSILTIAGLTGVLPMISARVDIVLAGQPWPWWVPLVVLAVISAAFAYLTGIEAVRRLGSSVASFVSLIEVIFAIVFAAILVSQQLSLVQLLGGIGVLIGIALVQRGQRAG